MTDTRDPTEIARTAIHHVLLRIATDPDARYLFGYGTESLRQLCRGYAALTGKTEDEVHRWVFTRPQHELGESTWDRLRAAQEALEMAGLR